MAATTERISRRLAGPRLGDESETRRSRVILALLYYDVRSPAEVARELETTTRYAEKLIHNCLKRVREIYLNITAVNR